MVAFLRSRLGIASLFLAQRKPSVLELFHALFLSRWSGSKPYRQAFTDHMKIRVVVQKYRAWRLILMPLTGHSVNVKRSFGVTGQRA